MLLSNPCEDDESLCNWVYDQTDSHEAANLADWLIGLPLAIIGLVVLGLVIRFVLHRLVDRLVARAEGGVLPARVGRFSRRKSPEDQTHTQELRDLAAATRRVQRAKTMGDLLKSVITGVLIAIFGTMILSQLGVNIAPIIASAGILGIALGFGAQSLVKDFLSGIFMIFEDQFGVGDVVDVGEASGTVEAVSLRVTRLRDLDGTVWYVPNGEILRVGNKSQNWSRAVVDIGVGYDEDLARAKRVLHEVAQDLWEDEDYRSVIIEEPEVTGVEALTPGRDHAAGAGEDPADGAVGASPASCGSGSRRGSTTRASRSRTRSGWSGTARAARSRWPTRMPVPTKAPRSGADVRPLSGQASAASSVIDGTDASAWLTGQLAFASSAAATKSSLLMPSTLPRTVSRISVIPVPGTKSTSAEVSSEVGGVPALASPLENAIEKHAECAAAISSSGLVLPFASSAREAQDTS